MVNVLAADSYYGYYFLGYYYGAGHYSRVDEP
jgi:hypothetical protein